MTEIPIPEVGDELDGPAEIPQKLAIERVRPSALSGAGARPAHARAVSRRGLLSLIGAGTVGAALGVGGTVAATHRRAIGSPVGPPPPRVEQVIRHNYSPHGRHQAGILTPMPAVSTYIALDLRAGVDKVALGKLLRLWSADIAALMGGRAIPGDATPEMAQANVSLSVTVGLGPKIFELDGLVGQAPAGFVDIPPMNHDRLQPRWCGGDLLLIIGADDPTSVAYAQHCLLRDADTWATVGWVQHGSWRGTNADGNAITGRNLFGQLTGSANPVGATLENTVWTDAVDWFAGGTQVVIRRIEMDIPEWEKLTRERMEKAIGRRLDNGAPLTGGGEFDQPDLSACDVSGNLVIPFDAHVRRAHPTMNNGSQMLRRVVNYVHEEMAGDKLVTSAGIIFVAYQANIASQFIPVQRSLDALDAMNAWTTAIGSAVFAVPPGFATNSWIGQKLIEG